MNIQSSKSHKDLWLPYAVGALIVSIMIIIFASVILWQEQRKQKRDNIVSVQNTATLLSNQLSGVFDEAETLLQAVDFTYRKSVASGQFDSQTFSAFLREALTWTASFSNIAFVDAEGIYRYDSANFKPFSVVDRDYFRKLRDRPKESGNRSTFYSDPIYTEQSKRWVIAISRRVDNSDGSFAGVVLLRWDISQLTESLKSFNLPQGDSIALLTENLTLVSRYPTNRNIESLIGTRSVSNEFTDALKKSAIEGTFRVASSIDQVERYYAYSKTQKAPFYVLSGKPVSSGLLSSSNAKLVLTLSGLMIILSILGAWMIYKQTLARLSVQLNNFADRVLAASPVAMFLLDKENIILNSNPAARELFGMGSLSVIGQKADRLNAKQEELVTPEDLLNHSINSALVKENLFLRQDGSTFTALRSIAALPDSAGQVDYFIETVVDVTTLKLAQEQLRQEANTDKLTGLLNRNAAEYVLNQPIRESLSTNTSFSLIMCDVDHFKRVNDNFGHPAGDVVLKNVAAAMKAAVRAGDYCIRWGGEEFLIVLPGCSVDIAARLAERIRVDIAAINHGEVGQVTMSFGVVEWNKSESVEMLISKSDEALYEAKHAGRNRVCVADAE